MDTGEAVAPPGVSSPGRGGTPIALISNMGPRPAALLGTTEQKADEFVRRVDFAMAHCAEPVIVNGLLRRHFVANMTGLGRNSQAKVLKYLAAQGLIELITKDGEQWLRRPQTSSRTRELAPELADACGRLQADGEGITKASEAAVAVACAAVANDYAGGSTQASEAVRPQGAQGAL